MNLKIIHKYKMIKLLLKYFKLYISISIKQITKEIDLINIFFTFMSSLDHIFKSLN